VCCSFLPSRSVALVAAFVSAGGRLTVDALLCQWDRLAAAAGSLRDLERAARAVHAAALSAHGGPEVGKDEAWVGGAHAGAAGAAATEVLLCHPRARVTAGGAECALAGRVLAAAAAAALRPSAQPLALAPAPPPAAARQREERINITTCSHNRLRRVPACLPSCADAQ
jgi:hypothetical protein